MKKTNIITLMLMLTVSVAFGQTFNYSLNYRNIKVGNTADGVLQFNGLATFVNGINVPLRSLSDSTDNAASTKFVKQLVQGLGSPLTFSNGLTKTGNNVALGGSYSGVIEVGGFSIPTLTLSSDFNLARLYNPISNGGVDLRSNTTTLAFRNSSLNFTETGINIVDELGKGLQYGGNYSSGFTNRSLVDKDYVDGKINSIPSSPVTSVNGRTGAVTGLAEASSLATKQNLVTLTTTGSSGAATFNQSTGALNIPNYTVTGGVTGSGTTNYIPKFTSAGTIGNSNLTDDGNIIMSSKNIAVSNSLFPQIALINDSKEWDIYVRNADKSFIFSENGIADRILIKTNGNVGFGVDNPQSKIDVNGSARASDNDGNANTLVRNTDLGSYVTTNTNQSISGTKTFTGGAIFQNTTNVFRNTNTGFDVTISPPVPSGVTASRNIYYPDASGTLAIQTPVFQTSGTSATLASSGRYIPQNGSLTIYTLPTTAAVGDVIFINGKGAGGWRISQNTGQIIHGATDTTTGSAGYVGSTARYNSIAIVCVTANTEWIIQSSQGSLTIN